MRNQAEGAISRELGAKMGGLALLCRSMLLGQDDTHIAILEMSNDFQSAAERGNNPSQCGDLHVALLLQAREVGLLDAGGLGDAALGNLQGLAELAQEHLATKLLIAGLRLGQD